LARKGLFIAKGLYKVSSNLQGRACGDTREDKEIQEGRGEPSWDDRFRQSPMDGTLLQNKQSMWIRMILIYKCQLFSKEIVREMLRVARLERRQERQLQKKPMTACL
jgi:hypothetical protein